jgi:hypothetical protein
MVTIPLFFLVVIPLASLLVFLDVIVICIAPQLDGRSLSLPSSLCAVVRCSFRFALIHRRRHLCERLFASAIAPLCPCLSMTELFQYSTAPSLTCTVAERESDLTLHALANRNWGVRCGKNSPSLRTVSTGDWRTDWHWYTSNHDCIDVWL